MSNPEPKVPDVVLDAICYNFSKRCEFCGGSYAGELRGRGLNPHHANIPKGTFTKAYRILREMRWSMDGCWLVQYAGMTVGIEPDGYIHS